MYKISYKYLINETSEIEVLDDLFIPNPNAKRVEIKSDALEFFTQNQILLQRILSQLEREDFFLQNHNNREAAIANQNKYNNTLYELHKLHAVYTLNSSEFANAVNQLGEKYNESKYKKEDLN